MNNSLITYRDLIRKFSNKMNLVSRHNVNKTVNQLIHDSLYYPQRNKQIEIISPVIDIGTGAGFPGLPLKLMDNSLEMTLLDSNRKKCSFLKMVIRELGLTGTFVINDRVENLLDDKSYCLRYNTLLCRGVGNLQNLIDWGRCLIADKGQMLLWKGSHFEQELADCDLKEWELVEKFQIEDELKLVRFVKGGREIIHSK